jgi:hypothetical protein
VAFVAAPELIFPRIFTDLAMTVPRRSPYCRDRSDRIKRASQKFSFTDQISRWFSNDLAALP